jgi:uncharacterized Ntn-hydrolase superfamily protein
MIRPSTFSIVAFDRDSGELGIAVQSKFLSVGAVVPWVRAGIGAVATQSFANTTFGPLGLAALVRGEAPADVVRALLADDDGRETRQVGIVDARGRAATFTGAECIDWAGGRTGDGYAAQGNCLAGAAVADALAETFAAARGPLSYRLVAALAAAQAAGGDKRGQQSAALIVEKPGGGYGAFNDRYVDLRVDDHPAPIAELRRILDLHALYFFPAEPHEVIAVDGPLGAEIARALVRVGALDGAVLDGPALGGGADGYDERVRAALVAYMHVENLENRVRTDGAIDRQTLDYLRAAAAAALA